MVFLLRNDGIPIRHRRLCPQPTDLHLHSHHARTGILLGDRMQNGCSTIPAVLPGHRRFPSRSRTALRPANDLLRHGGCRSSHAGIRQALLEQALSAGFQVPPLASALSVWVPLEQVLVLWVLPKPECLSPGAAARKAHLPAWESLPAELLLELEAPVRREFQIPELHWKMRGRVLR